jgi:hypothetical protein
VQIAGGGDNGIYFAGLGKQRLDALLRGDIHLIISPGAADADNVMSLAQFFADRATDGAAGTDNDNFHGRLLMR